MAKKTQQDPESATTQVNIADFQSTRDSVRQMVFVHGLLLPHSNNTNALFLTPRRGSVLISFALTTLSITFPHHRLVVITAGRPQPEHIVPRLARCPI